MNTVAACDYRESARTRLPRFLFDYIDGGANREETLRRNATDLEAVLLRQRVLRDVSHIDPSVELFGQRFALPVVLAPIGLAGLAARRGEVQAAHAANRIGIPFCLSTVGVCPIAEVARATRQSFWFQLYMIRDRVFLGELLAEVRRHGCSTLVFTVDMPVPGMRYRDYRSGFTGSTSPWAALRRIGQALVRPRWAYDVGLRGRPHTLGNIAPVLGGRTGLEDFMAWMSSNFDPSVTWADLEWIRERWQGPLVLKGILSVDDARQAAGIGIDGIVVSNHGGRQLDGVPSVARALPSIAQAVGERLTVLADGGVRSGLDVVRLLALGARSVLIGRAWVYALAAHGEEGVFHLLGKISSEMRVALALTGNRAAHLIDESTIESFY